jgi:hypothetical protein
MIGEDLGSGERFGYWGAQNTPTSPKPPSKSGLAAIPDRLPASVRLLPLSMSFVGLFWWLIRVLWWIRGAGMHRINHEARIHRANSAELPSASGRVLAEGSRAQYSAGSSTSRSCSARRHAAIMRRSAFRSARRARRSIRTRRQYRSCSACSILLRDRSLASSSTKYMLTTPLCALCAGPSARPSVTARPCWFSGPRLHGPRVFR